MMEHCPIYKYTHIIFTKYLFTYNDGTDNYIFKPSRLYIVKEPGIQSKYVLIYELIHKVGETIMKARIPYYLSDGGTN
jgi:hypothetical protein